MTTGGSGLWIWSGDGFGSKGYPGQVSDTSWGGGTECSRIYYSHKTWKDGIKFL